MTDKHNLIARLSSEAKPIKSVGAPDALAVKLTAVLALYGVAAQQVLGIRPDLMLQFSRPLFSLEIVLLAALGLASAVASVLAIYPDAYQKPRLLQLPFAIFLALMGVILFQLFLPEDSRMVMPEPGAHAMECALCIAMVALIPSMLIFMLLSKGASVRQFQAGAFAVLAATAVGGLTLRLSEPIDSIMHLTVWHYLPTLLFAIVGAFAGKWLLKW